MTMLVTLNAMKSYLGLTNTTNDVFLTEQIEVISEAVESYCGRIFHQTSYTQTFYADEMGTPRRELFLYHFPMITLTSVTEDGEEVTSYIRPQKPLSRLVRNDRRLFFQHPDSTLVVTYEAGFATIPLTIQSAVKSLVEERYNKKNAGLDLNFGRDVQSISIPGTINVQFDYTLQSNERKNAYGIILGDYVNILDPYRSERVLVGSIGVNYVD